MQNLGQPDEQIIQNQNIVILKSLFNMTFRKDIDFRGASNNQYFFSDYRNIKLFGYHQFVLNGQLKIMKKYILPGEGNIVFLDKSNEFFLIYPTKLELWKFDFFQKYRFHQQIYKGEHIDSRISQEYLTMKEIGINQDENIVIFQMFKKIQFFYKNQQGFWKLEQTIPSTDYYLMRFIRFNKSSDIFIALQVKVSLSIDLQVSEEFYLTIFNKNQDGIWQMTYHIQEKLSPFYFIDDHQFLLFQQGRYFSTLSEFSILDREASIKTKFSSGNYRLDTNDCCLHLIEIKSKNLALLSNKYFFSLKQQNLFWQSARSQLQKKVQKVGYAKNNEILFFKLYNNKKLRKFQVCSIYTQ